MDKQTDRQIHSDPVSHPKANTYHCIANSHTNLTTLASAIPEIITEGGG